MHEPSVRWLNASGQFILTTVRAGIRNRSIHGVWLLAAILIGVAYLSASFSPRQPQTVALDTGYSGIRFALVMLSLFWVNDMVTQEIERRTILFMVTYPVSRYSYIVGRYFGIIVLLALSAFVLGVALAGVVVISAGDYVQGFSVSLSWPFWTVVAGLWLDAAVVTAFVVCIASLSTVPTLPFFLGISFAIAGKSLGAVTDYLRRESAGDPLLEALRPIVDSIHRILPDLSRLDWREWPMYGIPQSGEAFGGAVLLSITYVALMLAISGLVFSRREFS